MLELSPLDDLLDEPLVVLNVGLAGFADELRQQQVQVVCIDWAPPAGGDAELADLLSRLGA